MNSAQRAQDTSMLRDPDFLRELFEDYIELKMHAKLIDGTLARIRDILLDGEGLDRPVRAWLYAERGFPELRFIRILSLAGDEDIDRFFVHNRLSGAREKEIKNWVFGYGKILREVLEKASTVESF